MEANGSFMHDVHCNICGASTECPSILTIQCGYDSQYDGEKLTLELCGTCADELMSLIYNSGIKPEPTYEEWQAMFLEQLR